MFRSVTNDLMVSPQIGLDAVAEAKALGVTLIINNRPQWNDLCSIYIPFLNLFLVFFLLLRFNQCTNTLPPPFLTSELF